jgi:hypothetical protein
VIIVVAAALNALDGLHATPALKLCILLIGALEHQLE